MHPAPGQFIAEVQYPFAAQEHQVAIGKSEHEKSGFPGQIFKFIADALRSIFVDFMAENMHGTIGAVEWAPMVAVQSLGKKNRIKAKIRVLRTLYVRFKILLVKSIILGIQKGESRHLLIRKPL